MEKWSKLPSDLVFLISDRLGVPDLLRFGAVCRSWQSVISERRRLRSSSHLQIPWLWFDTLGKGRRFYRPAEFDRPTDCRFYSIKQPEQETDCIGSGYGWLVITYKTLDISLLNPITGRQIQLPHLSTYFDRLRIIRQQKPVRLEDFCAMGPVYSGGDFLVYHFTPDGDCIVILMPSTMSRLAYARPGDKTWTVTTTGCHPVHPNSDVICHNGQIYTAMPYGEIIYWDFNGSCGELKPTIVIKTKPTYPATFHPPWLVSSPWGDLLYVMTYQTVSHSFLPRMEVYKADFEKRDLVKVVSLGEHALFRVHHSSLCLPVVHLPHLQRDCIYFKNDRMERALLRPQNREIGVYHLEDGTMQFSNLGEFFVDSFCMTWFLPSLA